jgi:hypothetical protein
LVEHSHGDVIDETFESCWPMVKSGHRRTDGDADSAEREHIVKADRIERGLAGTGHRLRLSLSTTSAARAIRLSASPCRIAARVRIEHGTTTIASTRTQLRATLPIGRVVTATDVAALAIHLMTNTALTGATYDIDGGQQFTDH